MNSDLSSLPDDARLSKNDIASLIEFVEQKYEEKIHYLEERIRLLQNELFGRKSENAILKITASFPFLLHPRANPKPRRHLLMIRP
ncbi:hypothetical protein [Desulfatitalea tepidiphila]|uniref:hypothetical protein n=1 Tax=Desulfatitalea tepidiphila TaxID=1185843 RepID=UPI0006B42121|nr:hypothetical protein [Desulfatitalea tepidiphila]